MAKFQMMELAPQKDALTARLGAGAGAANYLTDKEVGKFVKLAADSRYNLCAVGDQIEGYIQAIENATADDFTIGSVQPAGRKRVIADGLQGTPGAGTIAVGDYVVCGTVVAKGTALTTYPKVCKATTQTGMYFAWRVVAILSGTGAVGDLLVIERVGS